MKVLTGDIGGTNSRFLIAEVGEGYLSPIHAQTLPSADHATFEQALTAFFDGAGTSVQGIASVCFALAGPVEAGIGRVTNLPWVLEAVDLSQSLGGIGVYLINDFEAIGWGLEAVDPADILTLQAGSPRPQALRALIGAGTGLGQALMSWCGGHYRIHATEGGHADFAPQDQTQIALLDHLMARHGHVSYERLVSGAGLIAIFDFLRGYRGREPSPALAEALASSDPAAAISRFGLSGEDLLAHEALDTFIAIYGAQAGNLALTCLPRGGLFIAGGIAPKVLPRLQAGGFREAFLHKGRMREVLEKIPVHVVLDEGIGLRGGAMAAWRLSVGG